MSNMSLCMSLFVATATGMNKALSKLAPSL